MLTGDTLARAGIDAIALKPAEHDVSTAVELGVGTIVLDYEGREHLPAPEALATLADAYELFVTTPVRADGFDPLGDDGLVSSLPDAATRVLVAGNPAYLDTHEADRAIAPRLRAAREAAPDAWVGTEGIERIALAAGGTQFELLGRGTEREIEALRGAGFGGSIAVYAPTVLTDDPDETLNAIGGYVARRGAVKRALPEGSPTDAAVGGRAREILLRAAADYALVGDVGTVRERIDALEAAGADHVVSYPARGLSPFRD